MESRQNSDQPLERPDIRRYCNMSASGGPLPDWAIRDFVGISPQPEFVLKAEGVVSYGFSSYGYDSRLGRVGRIVEVTNRTKNPILDPKNFDVGLTTPIVPDDQNRFLLPPHSFFLGESFETFDIPADVIAVVVGKSTYARLGLIVNVTPLEAAWRGKITIEITNSTPIPAYVYAEEGIMQIIFFRGADKCDITYAERKGKYQDQTGLTLPFVQGRHSPYVG